MKKYTQKELNELLKEMDETLDEMETFKLNFVLDCIKKHIPHNKLLKIYNYQLSCMLGDPDPDELDSSIDEVNRCIGKIFASAFIDYLVKEKE